jgi:putative endonuclease
MPDSPANVRAGAAAETGPSVNLWPGTRADRSSKSRSATPDHLELGRKGEDAAAKFLKKQKFKILERNYRVKTGEIDIVAWEGNVLVFVEVKTRQSDFFARPIESVGFHKQQRLRRLVDRYLAEHELPESDVRFDVVSIVMRDRKPEIEHIRNAF